MQSVQLGDHVRIHYRKRFEDGSVTSSHRRAPLELVVGVEHPRLPGLGLALVGLVPGSRVALNVPPERAYGAIDPSLVQRWARSHFREDQPLAVGKWVEVQNSRGRRRLVRILEVHDRMVVVDTNHRRAGQAMELEVELLGIQSQDVGAVRSES